MRPTVRSFVVNAICLYVAAYLLTIILHELGHATMSWLLGGRPVLYNTSVENTNKALSVTARVLIAAAGPVLSLGLGGLMLGLVRRSAARGAGYLFWLYMGVFGIINFFGYLMIAPLAKGGDTGQIAALLHAPAWLTWATALLALVVLIRLIGSTGALFAGLLPTEWQADATARTAGLRGLIGWPWLVGSVVLVLLALPAPHPAVVANMFMSPMVLRRAYANAQTMLPTAGLPAAVSSLVPLQWLAVAATVALAVGFRLLRHGIAW
ncbi:hypothetical protein [Hymenobacter daeguensis]